jgi:TetR/AcrR family transcriptional regulator, lmrAB and yxaGH operons repressor
MIQAAETLLRESGLSGAGIKQLVARSGAPVGSVYHFFPGGKTQIVTETLRLHSAKVVTLFEHAFGDAAVPLPARLRALFRMAAKGFDRAGADKSCAIAGVTLDLRASDHSLRQVCDASFNQWVDEIASHLPWPDVDTRRSFATMVVLSLEGAFILARAGKAGDVFTTAGDWLARLAQSTLPASPGESHASSRAAHHRPTRRRRRFSPSGPRTKEA